MWFLLRGTWCKCGSKVDGSTKVSSGIISGSSTPLPPTGTWWIYIWNQNIWRNVNSLIQKLKLKLVNTSWCLHETCHKTSNKSGVVFPPPPVVPAFSNSKTRGSTVGVSVWDCFGSGVTCVEGVGSIDLLDRFPLLPLDADVAATVRARSLRRFPASMAARATFA